MPYDQKICDEYVNNLRMVHWLKEFRKDSKDALKQMSYVIEFLEIQQVTKKAAIQVENQIKRYLSQNENRLVYWEKRSKKSTKAYQKYCANKESA